MGEPLVIPLPFEDLDLSLLKLLHVLLEERGPTTAARRLGVSQPAVSRALAKLRIAFDDPLLVRKFGGMVLTPRAEALRAPLARWLADGQALFRQNIPPGELKRIFRIASTDFGIITVIGPALAKLAEAAPNVSLLVSPLTADSSRQLSDGELDLVITGFDPDLSAVHARYLFSETFMSMARPGHPLLEGDAISLDGFLDWPHIVVTVMGQEANYLETAEERAAERRIILWTPEFSIAAPLVLGSDALVTLPKRAASQFAPTYGLELFQPPLELKPFDYWLTWHERSHRDPSTSWLIEKLAEPFMAA